MDNMSPDELYVKLHEKASVRKKRTLELINEACRKQSESGVKDFSIGTITKLIADDGGPSEQTLRNKAANDYRALIKQWAEYSKVSTKKPKKEKVADTNDEILSKITNPTVRALVGIIMAENKKLKSENSLLKQQTTLTIDMRETKNVTTDQNVVLISASYDLTEMELNALKDAISTEFIKNRGWAVDEYGRVKENGIQVYKPGYVNAIKKVLKVDL